MLSSRVVQFVAPLIITLSVASAAVAYWTGIGTGTVAGASSTPLPLVLTPGVASQKLHPAGNASVAVGVANPNLYSLRFEKIALDTAQGTNGFSVDAGHAACSLATLGFSTQTNSGAGWLIPAKVGAVSGTLSLDLTGAASMSVTAADACQGATFTVYLMVTA